MAGGIGGPRGPQYPKTHGNEDSRTKNKQPIVKKKSTSVEAKTEYSQPLHGKIQHELPDAIQAIGGKVPAALSGHAPLTTANILAKGKNTAFQDSVLSTIPGPKPSGLMGAPKRIIL